MEGEHESYGKAKASERVLAFHVVTTHPKVKVKRMSSTRGRGAQRSLSDAAEGLKFAWNTGIRSTA